MTHYSKVPLVAKICPKCITGNMLVGIPVNPQPNSIQQQSTWCSVARCPKCDYRWYVCLTCPNVRQILDTELKLKNHSAKYHSQGIAWNANQHLSMEQKNKRNFKKQALSLHHSEQFELARNNLNGNATLRQRLQHVNNDVKIRIDGNDLQEDNTPSRQYGGIPTIVKECEFSREESTEYFGNNHHHRNGTAYLISRSFYSNNKHPEDLPPDDLQMCLKLALLVKTLTEKQSEMLGDFFHLLHTRLDAMEEQWKDRLDNQKEFQKDTQFCECCKCKCCLAKQTSLMKKKPFAFERLRMPPIPKDYLEIRQKILRGKNAFLTLLPTPKIIDMNDGHVYVLPSDCIKHFLSHGNQPMEFNKDRCYFPIHSFKDAPRGVAICRQLMHVTNGKSINKRHIQLSFLEWKDDCESAKSNKFSKNALWLFTMTIFQKTRGRDSPVGTFAVAIGPKGKSHDAVERVIGKDIYMMRHNAIPAILGWDKTEKAVPCTFSADLYMSLGDQPERRGGNVLQLGRSHHHARWRHAIAYAQVLDVIPACPICFQKMLLCDLPEARNDPFFNRNSWRDYKCNVCTNWAMDLSNPSLQFKRPQYFPNHYVLGGEFGEGNLSPIVLTHEILEKVMDLTFNKVSHGEWTAVQGKTYLTANCINNRYAKVAVARAINVLNFENAKGEPEDETRFRKMLLDKSKYPHKYEALNTPALYERGVPLHVFVDTPMHLLLLGVCRTVFRRISTWSARLGRKAAFIEYATDLLDQLEDLKLSWLKFVTNSFSSGWGGWVSKNYGSLIRVALWIYGPMLSIPDEAPYQDPMEDPKHWKVTQLREWLRVRGLPTTGNKPDLQPRVMNYVLGDPRLIPPILPVLCGSKEEMWSMLKAMLVLVTTLFQDKVDKTTKDLINLRVRIFLTSFEIFEKPMRKKDSCTWLTSYNFLCLLNLAEAVEEFGPCRRWFEGKWLGERFVSEVKEERTRCPPKNVPYYLMRNLHCSKAINEVVRDSCFEQKEELLGLNTHVYDSNDELETRYHSRNPLPTVILECGSIACLFYEKGKSVGKHLMSRKLTRTELVGEDRTHHGLVYWYFGLDSPTEMVRYSQIVDFAVLLQKVGCATQGVYTMVSKNWSTEMYGEPTSDINEDQGSEVEYELPETKYEDPLHSGWI